jgi:hypothetical protein
VVEAVIIMFIPGSDKEKEYLEYLLKKYSEKIKQNTKTSSPKTIE